MNTNVVFQKFLIFSQFRLWLRKLSTVNEEFLTGMGKLKLSK